VVVEHVFQSVGAQLQADMVVKLGNGQDERSAVAPSVAVAGAACVAVSEVLKSIGSGTGSCMPQQKMMQRGYCQQATSIVAR
jgi:hypothetical protein